MQTSEVLNKAADLIEERGWIQGTYVSPDGVCAMGAIRAVAGVPEECQSTIGAPEWHAGLALTHYVGDAVAVWNDRKGRTARDVIEALRSCALVEAAKEDATLATDFLAWQASEVPA